MSEELKNIIRVSLTTTEQDMLNDYITNLQEENESLYKELKLQKGTTRLFKNNLLNVMGNFMGTELDAFEQQEKEKDEEIERLNNIINEIYTKALDTSITSLDLRDYIINNLGSDKE